MSFDAGTIEATFTGDRTPFSAELAATKREAKDFADGTYTASLKADSKDAYAVIKATEAAGDLYARRRYEATLGMKTDKADKAINDFTRNTNKKVDDSTKHVGLLRTAIELLGPALVPLSGGVIGLSTAFVGLGAAGLLTFKGIATQMKANTGLGQQYHATLSVLQKDLNQLERTSAGNFFASAATSVNQLHQEFPALNADMAQSSKTLGAIAGQLVHGLVGGFTTFNPLIQHAEGYINQAATAFDKWATGPGGAKFAQTLGTDLDHMIPTLVSLGTTLVHLFSALNPLGSAVLTELTALTNVINAIPVPVLTALAIGYVAFRTAVAVTAGITGATKALQGFSKALTGAAIGEAEAGAASRTGGLAGMSGSLGRIGGALIPVVAGWAAGAIALNALSSATDSWAKSSNNAYAGSHDALAYFGQLALGNFSGADATLNGYISNRNANQRQQQNQQSINDAFNLNRIDINEANAGGLSTNNGGPNDALSVQRNASSAMSQQAKLTATLRNAKNQVTAQLGEYIGLSNEYGKGSSYAKQALGQLDKYQTDYEKLLSQQDKFNNSPAGRAIQLQQAADRTLAQNTKVATATAAPIIAQAQQSSYGNLNIINSVDSQRASLTDASQLYGQLSKSIQNNITAEEKWTDTTGKKTVTLKEDIDGIKNATVSSAAYSAAEKMFGKNSALVTGFLVGQIKALGVNKDALATVSNEQKRVNLDVADAMTKYKLTGDQVDTYASLLGITFNQLGKNIVSERQFSTEIGLVAKSISNGSTSLNLWVTAVQTFDASAKTAADRGALIGSTLVAANGDALSYANSMVQASVANQSVVTDFGSLKKGVVDWKTGVIDFHNAAAAPLLSDLAGMQTGAENAAAATYQHETALHKAGAAADAFRVYTDDTSGALVKELSHMGYTTKQAQALAKQYFNIKSAGQLKTDVEAIGADKTQAILGNILSVLDKIAGIHHFVIVNTGSEKVIGNLKTMVGLVQRLDGNHDVSFSVLGGAGSQGSADGNIINYYGAGGIENHVAQIARPANTVRVWAEPETGGEAYIPFHPSKRARSRDIAAQTVGMLGGVALFETGGYHGVQYPTSGTPSTTGSSGGSSGTATKWDTYLRSINQLLDHIPDVANYSIDRLDNIGKSFLSLIKQAETLKVIGDATYKAWKGQYAALHSAEVEATRADAVYQRSKTRADAQATANRANVRGIRSTVTGGFDITSSGNGYAGGIQQTLKQAVADERKYLKLRNEALKLGLNKTYIEQFDAENPAEGAANLQAIVDEAKRNPEYIRTLNREQQELQRLGTQQGREDTRLRGGQRRLDKDREAEKTARRIMHQDNKIVHEDLDKMIKELRDIRRDLAKAGHTKTAR